MAHAQPSNFSDMHNVGFNINGQKFQGHKTAVDETDQMDEEDGKETRTQVKSLIQIK